MIDYIDLFISERQLSLNSQKSYYYDLKQFCHQVGNQIDDHSLRLYQMNLSHMTRSVQRRKLSSVNQFLHFLYDQGYLSHYYRLTIKEAKTKVPTVATLQDMSALYEETPFYQGQLIALLILELGLLPSDIAQLKMEDLDLEFHVLSVKRQGKLRILPLTDALLPLLHSLSQQTFLFEYQGKPYSRQWFFNRLTTYLRSLGMEEMTAQELRVQFILRQVASGLTAFELAKQLGLKSPATLEKYYKHGY